MQTIVYVFLGILILGICVIVHEFGHYFAARRLGIHVVEFAVGMGPKLFGWEKRGTQYSLRLIPFGGYCAFESEEDENSGFNAAPAWKRLIMTLSGPLMNFVLGLVVAVVILSCIGESQLSNRIVLVSEGTPAQEAGLLAGDRLLAADGQEGDIYALSQYLSSTGEAPVELTVDRDGETLHFTVGKQLSQDGNYLMGVSFGYERQRLGFFQSVAAAFRFCVNMVVEMVRLLGNIFFHGEGLEEVSGPVGVVTMVTDIAQQSFADSFLTGLDNSLRILLLISLNLGLMNLLPLPALDGGRVVLLAFEAITGKHMPRRAEAIMHTVALLALLALILVITGRDVLRLFGVGV